MSMYVYVYQHYERRHIYFALSDIWDTECTLYSELAYAFEKSPY